MGTIDPQLPDDFSIIIGLGAQTFKLWTDKLIIHPYVLLSDSRLGEFRRHSFSKYLVIVLFHMHLANITYLSFTHYLTT